MADSNEKVTLEKRDYSLSEQGVHGETDDISPETILKPYVKSKNEQKECLEKARDEKEWINNIGINKNNPKYSDKDDKPKFDNQTETNECDKPTHATRLPKVMQYKNFHKANTQYNKINIFSFLEYFFMWQGVNFKDHIGKNVICNFCKKRSHTYAICDKRRKACYKCHLPYHKVEHCTYKCSSFVHSKHRNTKRDNTKRDYIEYDYYNNFTLGNDSSKISILTPIEDNINISAEKLNFYYDSCSGTVHSDYKSMSSNIIENSQSLDIGNKKTIAHKYSSEIKLAKSCKKKSSNLGYANLLNNCNSNLDAVNINSTKAVNVTLSSVTNATDLKCHNLNNKVEGINNKPLNCASIANDFIITVPKYTKHADFKTDIDSPVNFNQINHHEFRTDNVNSDMKTDHVNSDYVNSDHEGVKFVGDNSESSDLNKSNLSELNDSAYVSSYSVVSNVNTSSESHNIVESDEVNSNPNIHENISLGVVGFSSENKCSDGAETDNARHDCISKIAENVCELETEQPLHNFDTSGKSTCEEKIFGEESVSSELEEYNSVLMNMFHLYCLEKLISIEDEKKGGMYMGEFLEETRKMCIEEMKEKEKGELLSSRIANIKKKERLELSIIMKRMDDWRGRHPEGEVRECREFMINYMKNERKNYKWLREVIKKGMLEMEIEEMEWNYMATEIFHVADDGMTLEAFVEEYHLRWRKCSPNLRETINEIHQENFLNKDMYMLQGDILRKSYRGKCAEKTVREIRAEIKDEISRTEAC